MGVHTYYLNNFESPTPKDDTCQVWLKSNHAFSRRWKCKKFTDDARRTKTDGNSSLRWAKNAVKLKKVIFQKSQKLLTERAPRKATIFKAFNSYSFDFNGGLCNRRTAFCPWHTLSPGGEQFLWVLVNDLLRFHCIFLLFGTRKPLVFHTCSIRRWCWCDFFAFCSFLTQANLCFFPSNMLNEVFTRQTRTIFTACNSLIKYVCQLHLKLQSFRCWKRLCTDHHQQTFPRTAVGNLRGLLIKDAMWSTQRQSAWAISGSEAKVELGFTSSKELESLSHFRQQKHDQHQARCENTSGPRFAKPDFRNMFLYMWY